MEKAIIITPAELREQIPEVFNRVAYNGLKYIVQNPKNNEDLFEISPLKVGEVVPLSTTSSQFKATTGNLQKRLERDGKPIRVTFHRKDRYHGVVLRPIQK